MFGINWLSFKVQLIAIGVVFLVGCLSGHKVTQWYYLAQSAKTLAAEMKAKDREIDKANTAAEKWEKKYADLRRKSSTTAQQASHETNNSDVYRMQLPDTGVLLYNSKIRETDPASEPDAGLRPTPPVKVTSDSR